MPESWSMHAVRLADGLLHYVGDRRTIEFCDLGELILPVSVRLVADDDPAATHWAWIDAGGSDPCMIYPAWPLFSICFPYGPKAEVEAGKGRIARLAVTEVPDA